MGCTAARKRAFSASSNSVTQMPRLRIFCSAFASRRAQSSRSVCALSRAQARITSGKLSSNAASFSITAGLASCTSGTRVWCLLDGVNGEADLGEHLGGGLYAREVDYLCKHEWAQDAEDILWRRSKLGLFLSPSQQVRLGQYLQSEHPHRPRVHAA